MKILKLVLALIAAMILLIVPSSSGNLNSGVSEALKGRFLLLTEENNEAWYADPTTGKLHYLGRPDDAFAFLKSLALPISNSNLSRLRGEGSHLGSVDEGLAKQLAGRILVQIEDQGQIWYVWPENSQRYFIGKPEDAQRLFIDLGLEIDEETFNSVSLSDSYQQSNEVFRLAQLAVAQEQNASRQSNDVAEAYVNETLEKLQSNNLTVISFELSSPLLTKSAGYLPSGKYYWRVDGDLMYRSFYLLTQEYTDLEAKSDSLSIINEALALQNALSFYFDDINGYPLSEEGVKIGDETKRFLTNPNGFFGTLRDPVVYHEMTLPSDILDFVYFSDGLTYAITFSIPADTEFYKKGEHTLTPQEIVPGIVLGTLVKECEDFFEPVCASDNLTYPNVCLAELAGHSIQHEGACPPKL
jgi:hypothetical protein